MLVDKIEWYVNFKIRAKKGEIFQHCDLISSISALFRPSMFCSSSNDNNVWIHSCSM